MSASRSLRLVQVGAVLLPALLACACGSSTTTVTSPSTIQRCGVTLGAADATIPAEGGTGRVTVTTARECAWTATPEVAWLSIVGTNNGQGDGAIDFRVSPNADPVVRRGGIVLNDKRAEITQAGGTCAIQLRQPSASLPQSGGVGAVEVVASSPLCTWTAIADAEWITITSPATGTGNASVTFTVAPSTGPPRTASIRIGEQRFSITQSEGCSYSIAPTAHTTGSVGGTGTIAISTAPACPWTALSNAPWITVTQGSIGTGPGSVAFAVAPTSGPGRTGSLVVAGQAFLVSQSTGCSFEVAPLTHSAPAAGGNAVIQVAAAQGCGWTATSNAPWISVVGSATGNGTGAVTLQIAASTGGARSGTVTVADKTVTISQASGCTFAISPQSQTVPSAGGTGSVSVTAPEGCGWSAASQADWITITSGSTGSGNGSVQFSVAATTGPPRSGTLTIAGHTFTVTQSESCGITLAPPSISIGAAGGTSSFNVQTGTSCAWTAASQAPWISITAGAAGTGTGAVQLSIAPNSGESRTGTITVTGPSGVPPVNFTVTQSESCGITLAPSSISIGAAGGTSSFNVQTGTSCAWTAASQASWISITAGAAGTGAGAVQLSIAANSGESRTGTVTVTGPSGVAPVNFTVTQNSACSITLSSTSVVMPASGGSGSVNVSSDAACQWPVQSSETWIAITSGPSGQGNQTVTFHVTPNMGAARSGVIKIGPHDFIVNQESGSTFSIAPTSASMPAADGPGNVQRDHERLGLRLDGRI